MEKKFKCPRCGATVEDEVSQGTEILRCECGDYAVEDLGCAKCTDIVGILRRKGVCPECGSAMIPSCGCEVCMCCGFSPCK